MKVNKRYAATVIEAMYPTHSLRQLGKLLGISHERVRQMIGEMRLMVQMRGRGKSSSDAISRADKDVELGPGTCAQNTQSPPS